MPRVHRGPAARLGRAEQENDAPCPGAQHGVVQAPRRARAAIAGHRERSRERQLPGARMSGFHTATICADCDPPVVAISTGQGSRCPRCGQVETWSLLTTDALDTCLDGALA